jgi:DNA helicase HerA-like ATPase
MACSLFNICLSIFMEQKSSLGRIVALDEAHKYMGQTAECETLTNSLLSIIRLQRHFGARVVISTQEPSISPKLLDLCSITIVHRFTSPDWLNILTKHLAGISRVSKVAGAFREESKNQCEELGEVALSDHPIQEIFSQILKLKRGEALVFAPSAIVALEKLTDLQGINKIVHKQLEHKFLRIVVRARITTDGGKSIMAG